jgi:hypothetical protein
MGSRNIRMCFEPELENTNEINLVAPTGPAHEVFLNTL